MRRLTFAAVVVMAMPSSAGAAEPEHVAGPAFGDGDRSAYLAGRVVPDGAPLDEGDAVATPDRCRPAALGGGQLAFDCFTDDGAARPMLYDTAQHVFHEPEGIETLLAYERTNTGNGEFYSVSGVGRAMVQVEAIGNHVSARLDFDWHAGRFVESRRDSRRIENLDDRSGEKTLCAPIRLPRHAVAEFLTTVREPEPALSNGTRVLRWWGQRLALQRCGADHPLVLTRRMIGGPLLTARYVAWFEQQRLVVRLQASGRRIVFPTSANDVGPTSLSGTGGRLIISRPSGALVYTVPTA
jgi:hypothetical protein